MSVPGPSQLPPSTAEAAPGTGHCSRATPLREHCTLGAPWPTLPVDSVPRRMHRYTISQARRRHSAGSHCTPPFSWMDGEMLRVFLYQKYCVDEAFSHSSS